VAGDGVANEEIARRVRVDADTVRRWRARFATSGVEGIGKIAKGRGRKPWLPTDIVQRVLTATREHTPPGEETHWTTRSMAAHVGVGKDTVARIWADHGLKPWKIDTFKVSTDPRFEEKIVDVVGLYLDPPARAAVFSFDEKTSCQALDRTQPSLPLKRGRAATMTHDYKRHGTVDLFAAMNVATGQVHTHLRKGHAATDVLAFFKQIDTAVPRDLDVHVVLDNLSAHKAPAITEWLAHPRRSRWHLHFTPTSSSWLNLIERWFKELTDKRLRRGGSAASPSSPMRSLPGLNTGTPTPTHSCGKPPQRTSSPRSNAAAQRSTSSKQRRTTSAMSQNVAVGSEHLARRQMCRPAGVVSLMTGRRDHRCG